MMKLTRKEADAARKHALDYEANMAIEGLVLDAEGRKLADAIDRDGIGYAEGLEMVIEDLCSRHGIERPSVTRKEEVPAAE